mgnify:CR=1 FL=1
MRHFRLINWQAILISKKGETEKVKSVVSKLNERFLSEGHEHLFENRPWGKFEIIKEEFYYMSDELKNEDTLPFLSGNEFILTIK